MIANGTDRGQPALDRVTILAARAELAAMDIRMAISALLTHVSKNFTGVAKVTLYVLV